MVEPPRTPAPAADAEELARLLCTAGTGDQEAFAAVFDRVAGRVLALATRILRNRALAEEATQDVMVEVWEQAPRFDPGRGSALAWVLTIAHRRCVDRVRAVQAQTVRDDRYEARADAPCPDPTAEDATDRLVGQRARHAMRGLSEVQRTAVRLAFLDGLSQREVAEQLGIPLGTAKARIRDGLRQMRATMAEEVRGHGR
ncbi:sigma-70 family RNA polymerase sigma factor [Brachybacterium sp. AOP25-B2-12]|uniref:sigma-70 family RNA polymerase sigma factor n=1 Tax=Brachybacterium sp. AOP25-B2-12 TaxID=3457710 RepID=UPI004034CB5A